MSGSGVITLTLLLLQLVCTWAQFLSPLRPTGQADSSGVHTLCDDCSDMVQLNTSIPFGDFCHDECYISVNGIISFGEEFLVHDSEPFPGTSATVFYAYVLAPFWTDGDITYGGSITWEIYTQGGSEVGDSYLSRTSELIRNRENVNFTGNWTMIVNYNRIPPYFSIEPFNTFQAILITNGVKSYAVYTYVCGEIEWERDPPIIGFNAASTYYMNHDLSNTNLTLRVDCLALPSAVNNIVYDLVPEPDNVQCSEPTPTPPNSLNTCRVSGYDTCCVGDCPSISLECFCDATCHFFGDCCRDIDEICPRGNFTLGDTYLLFGNTYHINRVSVDGSSFEVLYTDQPLGGIVGLDYDYSGDYMYWSNTRRGTLNRANLDGSNPEFLMSTDDPLVYDIAVDWVSKKLYWTEGTRGKVLVMDIASRQSALLVANFDGSITRAIAVDPTTRYMYWTDWELDARIERAGMDGSDREILHDTDLTGPNGLTIDIPNQRIYWIDAGRDTIEFSNTDGSQRTLLERRDDEIFHPFSITLADEFLFWTDWVQLAIYTTHKDLPNDNVVELDLYTQLINQPHGIEAVTPDRQPEVANPCEGSNCNSTSICLLSPSSPQGYTCVCTDEEACIGPTPLPIPLRGSCRLAGYTRCCVVGLCRGFDVQTAGPAACTCDALCTELGTCCEDIEEICPEVHPGLCTSAGHEECCPAGSGCTDIGGLCSCDADCFENNTCCEDGPHICQNVSTSPTPTLPPTTMAPTTPAPETIAPPRTSPTPTLPLPVTEVPGAVMNLDVVNVSDNVLRVSWSAPESGGRVETYNVTVDVGSGETVALRQTEALSELIEGLDPEVPYYLRVEAINSLGAGDAVSATAFTREGTPSVGLEVTVTWTDLTSMEVSWVRLTLEQARGFITGYTVTYTGQEESTRRKRDEHSGTISAEPDQSSVSITDLDPDTQYSVSVVAETVTGSGVPSDPITAPSAGILFQLHFLDISSCEDWGRELGESERVTQIINVLISTVENTCSACDIQAGDIVNSNITLASCSNADFASATFRALLLGDPQENEDIIGAITKWVEDGERVSLGDLTVKLNSKCEIIIESLDEEFCEESTPTPPTATSDASSNDNSSNIVGIIVPVMVILVLIIIVLILVVAILLFRRRQSQKADPYLNYEEEDTTGTARLSQNLYVPSSGPREYNNPIYGEPAEETKTPLEMEYLEDPSILK